MGRRGWAVAIGGAAGIIRVACPNLPSCPCGGIYVRKAALLMISTTMRQALVAATTGMAMCVFAGASHAVQLWGIQPATNRIVRVDPTTGAVLGGFTPPGGALAPTQMFGGLTIAEQGAVLLYQNPVANPTSLFRLNPDTGALLSTEFMPAATANPEFRAGLSFESEAGAGGANAIFAINDGGRCSDRTDMAISR